MRAFVAIDLPERIRIQLSELSQRLRVPGLRASWSPPQNLHLTLRFLGDVSDDRLACIGDHLDSALGSMPSFPLHIAGLGAFPSLRNPSVVWVGAGPLEGWLQAVQTAAEQSARSIGLPRETRKFHPHITLARIKDRQGVAALKSRIVAERDIDIGEFSVRCVSLYTSQLTPKGAEHTPVRIIELRGSANDARMNDAIGNSDRTTTEEQADHD